METPQGDPPILDYSWVILTIVEFTKEVDRSRLDLSPKWLHYTTVVDLVLGTRFINTLGDISRSKDTQSKHFLY